MNIQIRFAEPSDACALKHIWKASFGDPDAYIDFYFESCFQPERAIVACCGKQVVGVIHLLPAQFRQQDFLYGYAIGVLPEFRGNGICERMHAFIQDYVQTKHFVYGIHPANEKLFSYYRETGLRDMYTLRMFDADHLENSEAIALRDIDAATYYFMRQQAFSPLVSWSENMIAYMLKEARLFGGFAKEISLPDGVRMIYGRIENDTAIIKETTMSDREILRYGGFIKQGFGVSHVRYVLPNTSQLGTPTTTVLGFGKRDDAVYMNMFLD